jgi:peptide/nickel transport system permease protein
VEVVFAWPGVGLLLFEAVTSRDYPMAEGAILLSGAAYIFTAIVVDILYGYADPRIRVN